MSLSSNSIIHLTQTKTSLKGILKNGFDIHYCRETIELGDAKFNIYVPMVSFCDIPLSNIKEHIVKYGKFGIGLTKEWAIKNKLNPVLYLEGGSLLSHSVDTVILDALSEGNVSTWTDEQKCAADILRYIKNYQGNLIRKGKSKANYRFSDEREWRYVPSFTEKCKMFTSKSNYNTKAAKHKIDSGLVDINLSFELNDIKYILVKNDKDIHDLIDTLRHVVWDGVTGKEIDRLTTRIFTTEQIKSDV